MSEETILSRRQLLGFGAVAPLTYGGRIPKNIQRKHKTQRLYHGPIRLPQRIVNMAANGQLFRTTSRHNVIRISYNDITYLFRTFGGDTYLGEIVRGETGKIRVHVWSIIDCPDARPLSELIAVHVDGRDVRAEQDRAAEALAAQQEKFE